MLAAAPPNNILVAPVLTKLNPADDVVIPVKIVGLVWNTNLSNPVVSVIKFKDDESKRMVIKALALVPVLDAYKLMNPNNSELTDYIDYSHDYTLIIEAREEKYRIQMIYEDGKYSDSQLAEYKLPFSAKMDFKTDELEKIMDKARIEMSQDFYDMTSKKKKEIYILSQPKVVRKYQETLKDYSTLFFQSIYKKVLDDIKSEDW